MCCGARQRSPSEGDGVGQRGWRRTAVWQPYAIAGVAAMLCYLNGLAGEFVHDDIPAVVRNKDVSGSGHVLEVFRNDFWGTPMGDVHSHKSYRPLTTLTFRANCQIFGLNALWFHVTNVLLHMTATLLFTCVCLRISRLKPSFAALAGLLFAVHPIHTETVTGVVGRADVLACVFFLISFLAYHGQEDKCNLWWSILAGGLSILAKETGITVFLVNVIFDMYKRWPNLKKSNILDVRWTQEQQLFAKRTGIVITSFGILVVLRLALLQGSLPRFSQGDNPAAFHPSIYVRVLTFSYLVAFNWWLLLCPATLSHDWQMGSVPLITSILDPRNVLTCVFISLAFLLVLRSVADLERQKNGPLILGLIFLILPFLPATNLFVTVGFVVAERVLYIPSLGCILLIVNGIQLLWQQYGKHRQTILSLLFLIVIVQTLQCLTRNKDWRSRESLLRAGIRTLPHNAKMHYNFGNFLRDSARNDLAMAHYYTALRLWPSYASAHNNLATLLRQPDEAEKHFLLAIKHNVDHLNAHFNLGQLYRKSNRSIEAEHMLLRCIKILPSFAPAYVELIKLKETSGEEGALLRKLVQLAPQASHCTMYAQWLHRKGNLPLALKYYLRALADVNTEQHEAIQGAAKIILRISTRSILFQLITRYHTIQRQKRGDTSIQPDIYLQRWYFRSELKRHAMDYMLLGIGNLKLINHENILPALHLSDNITC